MKRYVLSACLLVLMNTGITQARPIGAYWEEIPIIDNAGDTSDLTGYRSFDLFIKMEPGDFVYAADSGFAGSNAGLSLGAGQGFFQHEFGADSPSQSEFFGFFPDLEFDTRFQLGSLSSSQMQTLISADWNPAGVTGVVNTLLADGLTPAKALPNATDGLWAGRFTVSSVGAFGEHTGSLGESLGGQFFVSGSGTNGDFGMQIASTGVIDIPNAFANPTPGAAIVLGGFLLLPGRRHRARRQR